jgi:hypothetical protein
MYTIHKELFIYTTLNICKAYYMEKIQWFLTIQEKYGVWAFQCSKG